MDIIYSNPFYLTLYKFFLELVDSCNGLFFRERAKIWELIPIKINDAIMNG